jgi:hypothetical protein
MRKLEPLRPARDNQNRSHGCTLRLCNSALIRSVCSRKASRKNILVLDWRGTNLKTLGRSSIALEEGWMTADE